jgi:hypothetical protein
MSGGGCVLKPSRWGVMGGCSVSNQRKERYMGECSSRTRMRLSYWLELNGRNQERMSVRLCKCRSSSAICAWCALRSCKAEKNGCYSNRNKAQLQKSCFGRLVCRLKDGSDIGNRYRNVAICWKKVKAYQRMCRCSGTPGFAAKKLQILIRTRACGDDVYHTLEDFDV